jgi:hypothetical protein
MLTALIVFGWIAVIGVGLAVLWAALVAFWPRRANHGRSQAQRERLRR